MSYVAITDTLLAQVKGNIGLLKIAEMDASPSPQKVVEAIIASQEIKTLVLDKMWEREQDLRVRLSPYNVNCEVTLRVAFEDGVADIPGNTLELNINIGKMPVPCFVPRKGYYHSDVAVHLDASTHPLLLDWGEANKAHLEVSRRWDTVQAQVTKFLTSCKSLNEGLKLWPDLQRYIPRAHMDRVNTKNEKVKQASTALEALKALDLDTINSSTVIARMAGAKV